MGRTRMASILTVGGFAFALLRLMRYRAKPRGWRMITTMFSRYMGGMGGGTNRLARAFRR